MDDWKDATDPVPAKRELTEAEKARRLRFIERVRQGRASLRPNPDAPSYHIDPAFDDVEG